MAALDQAQQTCSVRSAVPATQSLQAADHSECSDQDAAWQAAGARSCTAAPADTAAAAAAGAAATTRWPNRSDGLAASADAAGAARWPSRSDCLYTACYCEENVYLLAQALQPTLDAQLQELFVVFVSNHAKLVPLWRQRAAAATDAPVLWDYHVLLILANKQQGAMGQPASLVFDLDSTLPFPCPLEEYRRQALQEGGSHSLPLQYRRCYRVVAAPLFLRRFASDRSHMRDAAGGGWLQPPPPPYPCIVAAADAAGGAAATNTLPAYLEFPPMPDATAAPLGSGGSGAEAGLLGGGQQPYGAVLSEPAFLQLFGGGEGRPAG